MGSLREKLVILQLWCHFVHRMKIDVSVGQKVNEPVFGSVLTFHFLKGDTVPSQRPTGYLITDT